MRDLPRIVTLYGEIGSGKDTTADYLVEEYGFTKVGFSDPVYEALLAIDPWIDVFSDPPEHDLDSIFMRLSELVTHMGWDAAKRRYPEIRKLLRKVGTEAGRDIHGQDCWLKIMDANLAKYERCVIRDWRFVNEAQFLADRGCHEFWVLSGRRDESIYDLTGTEHKSEKMDPSPWVTGELHNTGTRQHLYDQVDKLLGTQRHD